MIGRETHDSSPNSTFLRSSFTLRMTWLFRFGSGTGRQVRGDEGFAHAGHKLMSKLRLSSSPSSICFRMDSYCFGSACSTLATKCESTASVYLRKHSGETEPERKATPAAPLSKSELVRRQALEKVVFSTEVVEHVLLNLRRA